LREVRHKLEEAGAQLALVSQALELKAREAELETELAHVKAALTLRALDAERKRLQATMKRHEQEHMRSLKYLQAEMLLQAMDQPRLTFEAQLRLAHSTYSGQRVSVQLDSGDRQLAVVDRMPITLSTRPAPARETVTVTLLETHVRIQTPLSSIKAADDTDDNVLLGRVFTEGRGVVVNEVTESEFNVHTVNRDKGFGPCIVRNYKSMTMPSDLTMEKIVDLLGRDRLLSVIDSDAQEDEAMALGDLAHEFIQRTKIVNVLSLEISNTKLGRLINVPDIVEQLDLASRFRPKDTAGTLKYLILSMAGSFTNFHVDFGGSSVYYHVVIGSKVFYLVRPSKQTLSLFEATETIHGLPRASFADAIDIEDRFFVRLRAGETLFLPSGWIHAVATPEDSIVIGGNFLHEYGEWQAYVAHMETRLNYPETQRFPGFADIIHSSLSV